MYGVALYLTFLNYACARYIADGFQSSFFKKRSILTVTFFLQIFLGYES
jgi:hypothetical protein